MAGLLAARALADHAESVVVLERERLSDEVAPRGRVPQGRHLHVLLSAGLDRLRQWFPGIEEELDVARCGPGRRHRGVGAPGRCVPRPRLLGPPAVSA